MNQLGTGRHAVQGLHGGINELLALVGREALGKLARGHVGKFLNDLVTDAAAVGGQRLFEQLHGALPFQRLTRQQGIHKNVGVDKEQAIG